MTRRTLGGLLWFMTIWLGWEIVWSVTGVSREIGPVLAACAAAFVVIDPTGLAWGSSATRPARRAHSLDAASALEVR